METEPKAKRPKRRFLKEAPCCWCGRNTECIHITKTLKCWDCRMKMIKTYQFEHRSMQVNNYNQ